MTRYSKNLEVIPKGKCPGYLPVLTFSKIFQVNTR